MHCDVQPQKQRGRSNDRHVYAMSADAWLGTVRQRSHGDQRVRHDQGWQTTLSLALLRSDGHTVIWQ